MSHLELIDPPIDVQQAVAAVIHACHGWKPTMVEDKPPSATEAFPMREAQVCSHINNPTRELLMVFDTMVLLAIIIAAVITVVRVTHLYRLPRLLFRQLMQMVLKREAP